MTAAEAAVSAGGVRLLDVAGRAVSSVLAALEAKGGVVYATEFPEEDEQEEGAGEDVEDAVPDHLGGNGDNVSALSAAPGDGVGDEHEGEEARADEVAGAQDGAGSEGRAGCVPEEDVPGE